MLEADQRTKDRMAATPNHALQRTAPCVTAPASAAAFPPAMQVPRRTPRSLSLGSLGVATRAMQTVLLSIGMTVLLLRHALATPHIESVSTQQSAIETVHKADPQAGTSNYVTVRSRGHTDYLYYRLCFPAGAAISAISRKQGRQTITFEQLRVGQQLRFSGTATGDAIPFDSKHCTVFLP